MARFVVGNSVPIFFSYCTILGQSCESVCHANNGSNSIPVSEIVQSVLLQDNKFSVEYSIYFLTLSNYIFQTEQSINALIKDKLQLRLYVLVYLLWDPTSHKFHYYNILRVINEHNYVKCRLTFL